MYATFYLARHQKDPGLAHWKGLKRELRYLKGTKDLALKANKNEPLFEMCCDSDNGGDPNEGKSTTGIIARMHGIPILDSYVGFFKYIPLHSTFHIFDLFLF